MGSILLVLVFPGWLEHDDRTDRLAFVHQIEALVDLLELEGVGDHWVDLDLSVHVPVDDFRHIGAAACAAKRGSLPDAAGRSGFMPKRRPRSALPSLTSTPMILSAPTILASCPRDWP